MLEMQNALMGTSIDSILEEKVNTGPVPSHRANMQSIDSN